MTGIIDMFVFPKVSPKYLYDEVLNELITEQVVCLLRRGPIKDVKYSPMYHLKWKKKGFGIPLE